MGKFHLTRYDMSSKQILTDIAQSVERHLGKNLKSIIIATQNHRKNLIKNGIC